MLLPQLLRGLLQLAAQHALRGESQPGVLMSDALLDGALRGFLPDVVPRGLHRLTNHVLVHQQATRHLPMVWVPQASLCSCPGLAVAPSVEELLCLSFRI